MQPRSLSVALAVTLAYSTPLTQSALAAKAHTAHRAAKHIPAAHPKHTPAAHPAPVGAGQGGGVPNRTPEEMQELSDTLNTWDNSIALSKQGDAAAKGGDWARAQTYYQQALGVWPDNSTALYGLGKCADAAGDTASAVRYYRTATFSDNSPHTKWNTQTNDVARLMEFVLLLNKAGQEPEALAVYRRAAHLLNYQDADTNGGKPYLDVLLPEFGNSPSEWAFTPQRMEAMAYVGHAYEREDFDHKLAQVELQKAIDLAPDSPVPYFYRGRSIIRAAGHRREALEDFHTAAQLGDDNTKAAADKGLKDWNVEHDAKVEQDREDLAKKQAAQRK